MTVKDKIEQFDSERIGLPFDIRAEVLLTSAMEMGLSADDFLISCDHFFYREYNRDIYAAEMLEDAHYKSRLLLHLSRNGIYDLLPEGLFYQPAYTQTKAIGAAEMAAEYKINKNREKKIRRFFLPFENEFFGQRLQIEQKERALLQGLQTGALNEYFIDFWGLPASLPLRLLLPFVLLLPYVHRIAGNLQLTAQCLEKLLREKVGVSQIAAPVSGSDAGLQSSLGHQRLGVNLVCGNTFMEDYSFIEVSIGPLQNSFVSDYISGGLYDEFLTVFYRFFMPADADIATTVVVDKKKQTLLVDTGENAAILGYSMVL